MVTALWRRILQRNICIRKNERIGDFLNMKKLILVGILAMALIFFGCAPQDEQDYERRTMEAGSDAEATASGTQSDSESNSGEEFPNVPDDDYTKRY